MQRSEIHQEEVGRIQKREETWVSMTDAKAKSTVSFPVSDLVVIRILYFF